MPRYPKYGQKVFNGTTREEKLREAERLEQLATQYIGGAAGELAHRDRELAAYLRECARRMEVTPATENPPLDMGPEGPWIGQD